MFKRGFTKLNIIGMIVGIIAGIILYPSHRGAGTPPPAEAGR